MVLIDAKIDDRDLQRVLSRKLKECDDLAPLMRRLAGVMADAVEENFDQEGRPRWAPLQPRTIKARERKGHWPGKILQLRGRLASSIVTDYGKTQARVGTNLIYAAIHQLGGTIKRPPRQRIGKAQGKPAKGYEIRIPARPFLSLTQGDLFRMKRLAEEYVTR